MAFHVFCRHDGLPPTPSPPGRFNPLDCLFSKAGLGKYGLDRVAEYCRRYARNDVDLKPWMPHTMSESAFLVDLHAHTALSDGEGTHESILRRVGSTGVLDAIAFTDHPWWLGSDGKTRVPNEKVIHHSWAAASVARDMQRSGRLPASFVVIPGNCEFAPPGTHAHPRRGIELIGAGLPATFIEDNGGLRRVNQLLAEDLVDAIKAAGGIAILPHPFYFQNAGDAGIWRQVDVVESFNQTVHFMVEPVARQAAITYRIPLIDAFAFVAMLFGYFSWRNRIQLAKNPRPEVGSSDCHIEQFAGAGCTMLDGGHVSVDDVLSTIARGRGRAALNPRWERHADRQEVIDAIWSHWGGELERALRVIARKGPAVSQPVRAIAGLLERVQHAHDRRKD